MKYFLWLLWLFSSVLFAERRALRRWIWEPPSARAMELSPHERTKPVLIGDLLYVGNQRGEVTALHRQYGYALWKEKMPAGLDGSLAYGRSKIFAGDVQGNFRVLNARDGSDVWKYKIQSSFLSPAIIQRNRVFVSTSADEIIALGEGSGKELWHYSHRGDEKMTIRGVPSAAVFEDEVFQGFSDGSLVKLAAKDGRVLWSRKLRTRDRFYDIDMSPYVDENDVIVATFDGMIFNLDRRSGSTHWTFNVGGYGGVLVEGDVLYFSGLDGKIYALNRHTGSEIWKTPFEKGVGLAPTRVGEHLVVTTSGDPVYLLEPKTGKIVWQGGLGSGSFASAVGHTDGWFYCLSNYGKLYSFQIVNLPQLARDLLTLPSSSAIYRDYSKVL